MKTAIQELIDIVQMDFNNGVEITMRAFNSMLKKKLKKEKQQIIDAVKAGRDDCHDDFSREPEEYYSQTFEQNEPDF